MRERDLRHAAAAAEGPHHEDEQSLWARSAVTTVADGSTLAAARSTLTAAGSALAVARSAQSGLRVDIVATWHGEEGRTAPPFLATDGGRRGPAEGGSMPQPPCLAARRPAEHREPPRAARCPTPHRAAAPSRRRRTARRRPGREEREEETGGESSAAGLDARREEGTRGESESPEEGDCCS